MYAICLKFDETIYKQKISDENMKAVAIYAWLALGLRLRRTIAKTK